MNSDELGDFFFRRADCRVILVWTSDDLVNRSLSEEIYSLKELTRNNQKDSVR